MTESPQNLHDSKIETKIKKKSREEFVKEFLKSKKACGIKKSTFKFMSNDTGFLNNDFRKNK